MAFMVYVIESAEGLHYTGMTEDMQTRLANHNGHTLSFWTKRGTDWKVVYTEEFEVKADALKREKWLKGGVGREYLKQRLRKG